jgi:hypothetical protein
MPDTFSDSDRAEQDHRPSWRDTLQVHVACEMFPLMSPDELRDQGEDIKQNGLLSPIVLWTPDKLNDDELVQLLDGRNRLDALEVALGRPVRVVCRVRRDHGNKFKIWTIETDGDDGRATSIDYLIPASVDLLPRVLVLGGNEDIDPLAYVISANIHRRHLSAKDKDRLIVQLLKANPTKSNRTVAKLTDTSHPHVAKVREQAEKIGDVETVTTSIDTKGRQQPAKRKQPARKGWSDERYRRHREKKRHARTEELAVELAGARKTVEILTESEEPESGPRSPGEVQRLQARIGELEDEVRRRDIEIDALKSKITELEAARASAERPDVTTAAEIVEANFDEFIKVMPRGLREKLERKVRAQKNGGDGDIDPNATITRMLQEAMSCAVAAEDPNTDPDGAVAKSNRASAQKFLRDTERKLRAMGFALPDFVGGIANGAKPKRPPTAANADKTAIAAAADTTTTVH